MIKHHSNREQTLVVRVLDHDHGVSGSNPSGAPFDILHFVRDIWKIISLGGISKQWFSVFSTVFEHDRVVSSTQKNFRARDAVDTLNHCLLRYSIFNMSIDSKTLNFIKVRRQKSSFRDNVLVRKVAGKNGFIVDSISTDSVLWVFYSVFYLEFSGKYHGKCLPIFYAYLNGCH